jgi:hypothetical protein
MKNRGELTRREPRKEAHDAQCESLWPGHTDGPRHSLGRRLQPVHNGPQQLHEVQDIRQLRGGHGTGGWRADGSTIL